jgi:hypothetical protein
LDFPIEDAHRFRAGSARQVEPSVRQRSPLIKQIPAKLFLGCGVDFMNKTVIMSAAVIVGLFFFALAIYYWLTPANALLSFLPGYALDSNKIHYTHGLAALILGAACLLFAWFQSGRKSTS